MAPAAQARLDVRFRLAASWARRIDAEHLLAGRLDDARLEPVAGGERYGIGQVELALGVVVADPAEQAERGRARAEAHDAGIAERQRALGIARVLLLADSGEPSRSSSSRRP